MIINIRSMKIYRREFVNLSGSPFPDKYSQKRTKDGETESFPD